MTKYLYLVIPFIFLYAFSYLWQYVPDDVWWEFPTLLSLYLICVGILLTAISKFSKMSRAKKKDE